MITNIKQFNEKMSDSDIAAFKSISKIGKITKDIKIEIDLEHSFHSIERQGRSTEYIKNEDIKNAVAESTEQLIDLLINNTLNIGDPVWIYKKSTNLNVVGSLLLNRSNDNIIFKVITCMYHKNFYNKNNTYKLTIESVVNELNTDTYAKISNHTKDGAWNQFIGNNNGQEIRVGRLAKELFLKQYYNEFPKYKTIINTSDGKYAFVGLSFNNSTSYNLHFEKITREFKTGITIEFDINTGDYYIEKGISITDTKSNDLILDMFKYWKR